jgi:hypothetical protein
MKGPEAKEKIKVRAYLKKRGAYRFSPVQMGIGASTLDDLVCLHGRFVGIEYKALGKRPTPRQELTIREIRMAGGIAIWGDTAECIISQLELLP